jgi:hypothetical protein
MSQPLSQPELFKRFLSWQCRLRKMCVRELGGQPSIGMTSGVYSVDRGEDDEKSRLNFLIVKQESADVTAEFAHIIRKTLDSKDWLTNGLRVLSERHYQDEFNFSNQLTALFGFDSALADALLKSGQCHLKFKQDSVEYAFDFDVTELPEQDEAHQATYWHNHLFNPSMPGKVRVLGLKPRL